MESDGKYRPLDTFLHGNEVEYERNATPRRPRTIERNTGDGAEPRAEKRPDERADVLPQDPLLDQIREGVARIDASFGRKPDAGSDRMTASLYALAKEQGMERVDQVVLGRAGTRAAEGEYVFLVKLSLTPFRRPLLASA